MTSGCCAEARHGVDHAQHLDDAADAVEVAQLGLHGRDQLQAGEAGVLVGLLDRDVLADDAGVQAAVRPGGPAAGQEEQVAGEHGADVVGGRRGGVGSTMPSSASRCSIRIASLL